MRADYGFHDITAAFQDVGVQQGDSIFIHSNLGFLGMPEGARNADDICSMFLKAIQIVIGNAGTLVVPAFSYSFCHGELYNPESTASACGMFSEYVRVQRDVRRSLDPNFSIAAWGRLAEYYTDAPAHESFGKGSFWERLLEQKGKIICVNMDCGSTFVHYIEHFNQVPYRYNKAFNGVMVNFNGMEKRDYFVHYVYDLERPGDAPCFKKLDKKCRESGICKNTNLGRGVMLSMESTEYFDLICKELENEPGFLTVGGCRNCE